MDVCSILVDSEALMDIVYMNDGVLVVTAGVGWKGLKGCGYRICISK